MFAQRRLGTSLCQGGRGSGGACRAGVTSLVRRSRFAGRSGRVVAYSGSETSGAETDKGLGTSSSSTEDFGSGPASLEGLSPAEALRASKESANKPEQVKFSVTKGLTEEDLQAMQKYAESVGIERIARGALIEARLIEWPGPPEALFTTLIVIVMVGGSAGLLFVVNTILAKTSEWLFN